jgi:transposase-like protein
MKNQSQLDKALANVCLNCPACRRARKRQRGAAFWLVQNVESRACPFCRAYERVFRQKAHERREPKPETPSSETN